MGQGDLVCGETGLGRTMVRRKVMTNDEGSAFVCLVPTKATSCVCVCVNRYLENKRKEGKKGQKHFNSV